MPKLHNEISNDPKIEHYHNCFASLTLSMQLYLLKSPYSRISLHVNDSEPIHLRIWTCAISFGTQNPLLPDWSGTYSMTWDHTRGQRSTVCKNYCNPARKAVLTWMTVHHENTECDFAYDRCFQFVPSLQTPPILNDKVCAMIKNAINTDIHVHGYSRLKLTNNQTNWP